MKVTISIFLLFSLNCFAQELSKTNASIVTTIIKPEDTIANQANQVSRENEQPKTIQIGMTYQELKDEFAPPKETILLPKNKMKLIYENCVVYLNKNRVVIIIKS